MPSACSIFTVGCGRVGNQAHRSPRSSNVWRAVTTKKCLPAKLDECFLSKLVAHRLLWTNYRSNVAPGSDSFGHHATELGWRVIEHIWQHDPLMRKPDGAPTGPNNP